MKILYDGQIYAAQGHGGINRYFANLVSRLPLSFQPLFTTCQADKANHPVHPNLKSFYYKRFGFRPGRLSYWLEQYYFRLATVTESIDIVHPTYYSLLTRQKMSKFRCPIVLTVYDMIHEIFSSTLDPTGQQAAMKRSAIMSAQAVICISENTKKDLLERYPLAEERVFVTPLAHSIDSSLAYGSEPVPSQPYFIYVGGRATEYKNFDRLLAAFAKVISVHPDASLCVVGAPFSDVEERSITELGLRESIKHYRFAGDNQLAKLYRCSIGLVYPSLYEGFGIPPLEAMACGTAVVASNSSSIPEVVGNAGLLFNPTSEDDLAQAMLHLLESPAERQRLITEGQERVKAFSWDKMANQTVDVYHAVSR